MGSRQRQIRKKKQQVSLFNETRVFLPLLTSLTRGHSRQAFALKPRSRGLQFLTVQKNPKNKDKTWPSPAEQKQEQTLRPGRARQAHYPAGRSHQEAERRGRELDEGAEKRKTEANKPVNNVGTIVLSMKIRTLKRPLQMFRENIIS